MVKNDICLGSASKENVLSFQMMRPVERKTHAIVSRTDCIFFITYEISQKDNISNNCRGRFKVKSIKL